MGELTGLDMHSCSFLALSLQALAPTRSPALAQHPSMAVSSRAQAWMCCCLLGLTLSCV